MTAETKAKELQLFDSHCHVFREEFEGDFGAMLERAAEAGVGGMIVVGTTAETSEVALELSAHHEGLHGTAGLHPHEAAAFGDETCEQIRALAERDDCVAVGESGLDWFKDGRQGKRSWRLSAGTLRSPVSSTSP